MLILGFVAAAILSVMLLTRTAELRYQRDVNRMVYNDNLGVLNEVKSKLGMTGDSLKALLSESPAAAANQPYIVVSMADHRLWYKQGKEVLYEAPVATGSGKELVGGSAGQWRFETPRGRLTVKAKDEDPAWVPPDWHYVEQAHKKGTRDRPPESGTVCLVRETASSRLRTAKSSSVTATAAPCHWAEVSKVRRSSPMGTSSFLRMALPRADTWACWGPGVSSSATATEFMVRTIPRASDSR